MMDWQIIIAHFTVAAPSGVKLFCNFEIAVKRLALFLVLIAQSSLEPVAAAAF
jgi:hypothetical protein